MFTTMNTPTDPKRAYLTVRPKNCGRLFLFDRGSRDRLLWTLVMLAAMLIHHCVYRYGTQQTENSIFCKLSIPSSHSELAHQQRLCQVLEKCAKQTWR